MTTNPPLIFLSQTPSPLSHPQSLSPFLVFVAAATAAAASCENNNDARGNQATGDGLRHQG